MNTSSAASKPVRFIDNPGAMQQCLQDLAGQRTIAFDLEFDSHSFSYGINLCLIQVATPDTCYIIDPFSKIDLSGLYAIFENERIEKIVHAPGEDLRLLHSLGCFPKNLFDTEVTVKLLNYEQTSLAAVLQDKLSLTMSKKQQRSNWLRRPLTPEQIEYAASDVAFLHALKPILEKEAAEKGLMPFVLEEQEALSTTIHRIEVKDNFLKPADMRTLSPRDQHVLNGLFRYRDSLAQDFNKPAYQVIDEAVIRSLADGSLQPADFPGAKGVHRDLKTGEATSKLSDRLQMLRTEAAALPDAPPARVRQSREQHAAREKAAVDKTEKFAPVQQTLAQRYGEFSARFILSNALVNDLLMRTATIGTLKRRYKQELVRNAAQELGIDLDEYE